MTETEGGWQWTGTVGTTQYFAFATELDPNDDWNLFNSTMRLSPAKDGTEATVGEYELGFVSQGAAFKGCGTECTFLVTKNGDAYSLKVTLNGDTPEPPVEHTWGLVGGFNNWNGDEEFTKLHEGMWSVNMAELDGEFKIRADKDWGLNYGAATGEESEALANSTIALTKDGFNITISNGKGVTFFFQPEAKLLTTKLNCGKATPLALRGGVNEWAWTPEYCLTETAEAGVYSVAVESLPAGSKFKIADEAWINQYTSQNTSMQPGEEYDLTVNYGTSKDMGYATDLTDVTIVVNTNTNKIKAVTNGSGVEAIGVSTDEAVYYNLQGARVENPENGIFIRIVDGKATKVVK